MNTVVANQLEECLGDRATSTIVEPKVHRDRKMLALRWYGSRDVRVEQVPVPTIIDPTDVVCKVTGTTICGSDLHLYHKEIQDLKKGDVLGHEWCGVVDEVGSEVNRFKKGDRVVASFQIACGKCEFCKRGLTPVCTTINKSTLEEKLYGKPFSGLFGYAHFVGGFAGGQAEYVRCQFADTNLLKIPDDVPDEKALYLSDIIPTSYHAVECAEVNDGKSVAIWGMGPVGLYAVRWSAIKHASRIIAIDSMPERLRLAMDLGATNIIDFSMSQADVVSAIYELEEQGVDCCIDAAAFRYTKGMLHTIQRVVGLETDSSEIVNQMIRAVKKFGNIALVADYAAMTNQFLIGALMEKGLTMRGTGQAPVQKYWEYLLQKIRDGEFDPTVILSHRFSIDDMSLLYNALDSKLGGIMKMFVQTKFSNSPAPNTPKLSVIDGVYVKQASFI